MRIIHSVGVWALFSATILVGCSAASDHPAAGAGGGTVSGGTAGGGVFDAGASDAEGGKDASDAASACEGATQEGAPVAEMIIQGTPPPALGGSIAPGTYVLSELDAYGALASDDAGTQSALTGVTGRATIVVTATTLIVIGARAKAGASLPADTTTASTFVVAGTTLQTTGLCPQAGQHADTAFSAVGGGLALFVGDAHREVYAKQ